MSDEELLDLRRVNLSIISKVNQLVALVAIELGLDPSNLLSDELRIPLVVEVHPPASDKQFSRFRVEQQVLLHVLHVGHLEGSLFSEEACMERISWQEGVTEFAVPKSSISVSIVSRHVEMDVPRGHAQVEQREQARTDLIRCDPPFALGVENSEGVDQVEISPQRKINLYSLKQSL